MRNPSSAKEVAPTRWYLASTYVTRGDENVKVFQCVDTDAAKDCAVLHRSMGARVLIRGCVVTCTYDGMP